MFKKKKERKRNKKTYTGEKARNIHHYALLPKPNKHSCRCFGGSPSAFISLEHNSFVNVSYGKIKMNGKTKSSPNGYQRHFEFSYKCCYRNTNANQVISSTEKKQSFLFNTPEPQVQLLVKKIQRKVLQERKHERPTAAAAT